MKKILTLVSITTLFPLLASAESSVLPLSLQHKAAIEVSTGIGTGNIDNQNFKVSGKLTSTKDKYTNILKANYADLDAKSSRSDGAYGVNDKLKYAVGDSGYGFGEVDYVKNDVKGIKSRTSELVGYGHEFIKKDDFSLVGEAGGGFRQSSYKPGLNDESSYLGKIGTDMNWQVYNGVDLNNNTYMALTEDNTQMVSDTSVKTFVYKSAYVKGGLEVENNSHVPSGYEKTDTVTSVGVGYEF